MEKEGLLPYLVGFDQGAFSKKYMTFLLGVVGVKVTHERELVTKMEQLEEIGVHICFTVQEHEEKLTERQKIAIEREFFEREWASPEHRFVDIEDIKGKGGRLVCSDCVTSKCKCRCRREELANPQGFLEAVGNVRCVWGVSEKDLTYLERGFEQLCMATLSLTDHHEDIPRKIDQIIAGNDLFCALEENLALWIVWLCSVVLCLFPFNYLTFDHVLSHPQLYFALVYLQLLLGKHQLSGSAALVSSHNLSLSKRKRQMLGLAIKTDILLFVVGLTVACYVALNNPLWFSGGLPRDGLAGFSCDLVPSFYHNPAIAKAHCFGAGGGELLLFSKVGTFIFLLILLTFTLRSAITIHRPVGKGNLLFHILMVTVLLLLVYFCPQLLQAAEKGLSWQEVGICLGSAAGIVGLGLVCRACVLMTEAGKIFHFEIRIGEGGNEYTELLKDYRECRTLSFPLDKELCPQ
jgi:hypothetical protein